MAMRKLWSFSTSRNANLAREFLPKSNHCIWLSVYPLCLGQRRVITESGTLWRCSLKASVSLDTMSMGNTCSDNGKMVNFKVTANSLSMMSTWKSTSAWKANSRTVIFWMVSRLERTWSDLLIKIIKNTTLLMSQKSKYSKSGKKTLLDTEYSEVNFYRMRKRTGMICSKRSNLPEINTLFRLARISGKCSL